MAQGAVIRANNISAVSLGDIVAHNCEVVVLRIGTLEISLISINVSLEGSFM